jgi:hypothetical protein
VLARRSEARFGGEARQQEVRAAWGEWTVVPGVPAGARRILRAEIRPSLWGRLRTFGLRLAPVFIEGRFRTGVRRTARVVPYTLVNGGLFEGFPVNLAAVSRAFGAQGPGPDPMVSFRFHTAAPAEFASTIRIVWSYVPETQAARLQ